MDPQRSAPLYNIKAVARLTGIAADTLRRWESRYGIISPQRTGSGYRLYSQRDVDTIMWLKSRLAEGMSISRACEMLRQLGGDPGVQPALMHTPQPHHLLPPGAAPTVGGELRSSAALRSDLLDAFREVDENRAGYMLREAVSLYTVEQVCTEVIQPALVAIGDAWQRGEVSVAEEHFASSFCRARLENIFHMAAHNLYGPMVLIACAPEELHEIGAMFLAVFLRRAGYRVVYLGQNVPLDSLTGMVHALKPDAVCVSASRAETAAGLYPLRAGLDEMKDRDGYSPLLAYGGRVFNRYPQIGERLGGVHIGDDAATALETLNTQLRAERGVVQ